MSETLHVKPACAGATIIDPMLGERLPDNGDVKPRNSYWLGLLIRGDIVEIEPDAPEPAQPEPAASPPARPDRAPAKP